MSASVACARILLVGAAVGLLVTAGIDVYREGAKLPALTWTDRLYWCYAGVWCTAFMVGVVVR